MERRGAWSSMQCILKANAVGRTGSVFPWHFRLLARGFQWKSPGAHTPLGSDGDTRAVRDRHHTWLSHTGEPAPVPAPRTRACPAPAELPCLSLHPPLPSSTEGKENRRKRREDAGLSARAVSKGCQLGLSARARGGAERSGAERLGRAGAARGLLRSGPGGPGLPAPRPPGTERASHLGRCPVPGARRRCPRTHPQLQPPAGGRGSRAVPQLRRLPRPQEAPREAPRPLAGHGRRQPRAPAAAPRPGRGAVRKRNWGFPSRSPRAGEVCGAGAARRARRPSPGQRRGPAASAGHVRSGQRRPRARPGCWRTAPHPRGPRGLRERARAGPRQPRRFPCVWSPKDALPAGLRGGSAEEELLLVWTTCRGGRVGSRDETEVVSRFHEKSTLWSSPPSTELLESIVQAARRPCTDKGWMSPSPPASCNGILLSSPWKTQPLYN